MSQDTPEQSTDLEAAQLCTSCAAPNWPSAHFCAKCGAPLSSFATVAPFEHLFAEGFIYREAAERPRRLITVIGVWILFGIPALGGLIWMANSGANGFRIAIAPVALGFPLSLISLVIIWRTTRSYLGRKQVVPDNGSEGNQNKL